MLNVYFKTRNFRRSYKIVFTIKLQYQIQKLSKTTVVKQLVLRRQSLSN